MKKQSKTKENLDTKKIPPAGNQVDFEKLDIEKAFEQDLTAAMALLGIIRKDPQIRTAVIQVLEKYRKDAVRRSKDQLKMEM